MAIETELTHGHLLGGRLLYAQPRTGFRSGIEPVLLAACIPAARGQRVLEAGTGAGAGLLCLAARVPCIHGVGVERDPALTALARTNAAANRFAGLGFEHADITTWPAGGSFDHAFANPPYHSPDGTRSDLATRESAKRAHAGLFADWAAALGSALRPRGTLTFIVPAGAVPDCLVAMQRSGCPAAILSPLWPKPGRAAKLVLLRGVRGGRAPLRVGPGLVLHLETGAFTPAAEAILRQGAPLEL